jgi:hypothetical protein
MVWCLQTPLAHHSLHHQLVSSLKYHTTQYEVAYNTTQHTTIQYHAVHYHLHHSYHSHATHLFVTLNTYSLTTHIHALHTLITHILRIHTHHLPTNHYYSIIHSPIHIIQITHIITYTFISPIPGIIIINSIQYSAIQCTTQQHHTTQSIKSSKAPSVAYEYPPRGATLVNFHH